MKTHALPLLLAITASLAANAAHAATTGTLQFRGQINAGTCNLAAGDVNRTVTLPTIKVSDFDSSPSAGPLDFEISADCESDITNVHFLFTGTVTPVGSAVLFANTGTSGGTALWLLHRSSPISAIPANGTAAQRTRTIATTAKKAVLPLRATYYTTGAAKTPGTLASNVTVSITYN